MIKKIWFYFFNALCPIVFIINLFLTFNVYNFSIFFKVLIVLVSTVLSLISVILSIKKLKQSLSRFLLCLNFLGVIIVCIYSILANYNMLQIFASVQTFKDFILSTGPYGMIVYTLIQLLQVMFVPIPSLIITLTGVLIYGPFVASVLCCIAVVGGSILSFTLGKTFGFKLVAWVVGRDSALKYASVLNKRGKFFLTIAFLLPLFPDDALCLIAGMTTMEYKDFILISSITRPIGVICMCYFGGGYIIPFTGWGLYVWGFLLVLIIIAVIMVYKYQDKIEDFIIKRIYNYKKKSKKTTK